MKKKVLILEDDSAVCEILTQLLKELRISTEIFVAGSLAEAYCIVHSTQIELFLLDIILDSKIPGDVSGIHFAEELRKMENYCMTPIIFITGLEDPQLYAYRYLHIYEYIVKPFPIAETKQTIERVLGALSIPEKEKELCFRKDGILFAIKEKDIAYVVSKGHMLEIYSLGDVLYIPYRTCKEMLKLLDSKKFSLCKRGTIVNMDYVRCYDKVNRCLVLKNDLGVLRVSTGFEKLLLDKVTLC